MKTWSFLFLAVGAVLLLLGIFMWGADKRSSAHKIPNLIFSFIPAWSLLIMGWTGLATESVLKRLR